MVQTTKQFANIYPEPDKQIKDKLLGVENFSSQNIRSQKNYSNSTCFPSLFLKNY